MTAKNETASGCRDRTRETRSFHRIRVGIQLALTLWGLLFLAGCVETPPAPPPTPLPSLRLTAAVAPSAQPHLDRWTQRYQRDHPETIVEIRPSSAISAQEELIRGTVDLALLDQALASSYQHLLTATLVSFEPIAVVVHPTNPLRTLSATTLAELFSGRVTDWSRVGGNSLPVQVYLPPDSAGEAQSFSQAALVGRRMAPQALVRSSPASLCQAVARDPGGIGLLPASSATKDVAIVRVDGLAPFDEAYPWHVPLFLAYARNPSTPALPFIYFILDQGKDKPF